MSPDGNAETVGAQTHDAARVRMLLLRAAATFAALIVWQVSGASAHLLSGLGARFNDAWLPVHSIYFLITLAGLGVFMLPFSIYEDFILDARENGEPTDFEEWTIDVLKVFAFDLAVGLAFFLALYGLIEGLPRTWSLAAAALYAIVSAIIAIAPTLQGPPEDELGELRDPVLRERLTAILKQLHQPDLEVLRWHGETADEQALLALQGLGKRRRIIISNAMHRDYTPDEIAALLAHEASHLRNFDVTRFNLLSFGSALIAFLGTHAVCHAATTFGLPAANDLATFPLLVGTLLAFSFAGLPLLNAYTRRREYIADAIAARIAGEIPLRTAIEKLNDGGPAPAPPPPLDLLLNGQPAHNHRLWRLANRK